MSSVYSTYLENQTSSAYLTQTSSTEEASSTLDKEDFLTLLVTQLENQDPLEPMDDTDFAAQLAQYSSLEQLMNISEQLETLVDGVNRQEMLAAVSFIGKSVVAEGSGIGVASGAASTLTYTLSEDVADVTINIYDGDGNIVRTVDKGAALAGDFDFTWDGLDSSGSVVADGVYYAYLSAEDSEGSYSLISTSVSSKVTSVLSDGTDYYLELENGTTVALDNVYEVSE
jgi:flagellar basal-body rod modification protein FlgD